ncbi:hypothetical protein CYMTET_5740 [Cymbomonas tetramitiformis]|uniref:OBG-type G domain-containing protein n=1 Tax=Cymbomonas tetramitiformis TaxID=36881 RepID=A0AAE0GYJ4_9CHLO|nr:hypothetical protein CYMTET_5740 [Cymbomonas tetramitiformis]|eukprot:gene21137-25385_t
MNTCGAWSESTLSSAATLTYTRIAFSAPAAQADVGRRRVCKIWAKVRVGILGLPNVGKSSLFNALAEKSLAQVANFPFCTIEANVAPIAVPDLHLQSLGGLALSRRAVPASIDWADVAGLARGASRGEGLGNRFLAELRECQALAHVVRAFEDDNVVHVDGKVDPSEDAAAVNLELLLADLAHVERRLERSTCKGEEREALEAVAGCLMEGKPARVAGLSASALFSIKSMGLLTLKPVLYCFNVDEVDFAYGREEALTRAREVFEALDFSDRATDRFTLVSCKVEAEMSAKTRREQLDYLQDLQLDVAPGESLEGLLSHNALPKAMLSLLGLSIAYTGPGVPQEKSRTTRAHLFPAGGLTAEGLAGRIHGDIYKGFLKAEVVPAPVLLEHPTFASAKDAGCVRTEGREYTLESGEVVLIKWK